MEIKNDGTLWSFINGRTMLPIRFVVENLDFSVEWDGELRSIYIQ